MTRPWEQRRGSGWSDPAAEPSSRTPRRKERTRAGGGRGMGAAGREGALGEPPELRGAQASSAIHSCTGARAELLIAAIVTRGRCGSRASTLARDKWPLTAPPRQESSSDFTARRLSGLCLTRFPVRTFKSASWPSPPPGRYPPPRPPPALLRPQQRPGRAARSLPSPPHLQGTRWGAPGGSGGGRWHPLPWFLTSPGAEPRAPPPRPQDGSGYRAESGL